MPPRSNGETEFRTAARTTLHTYNEKPMSSSAALALLAQRPHGALVVASNPNCLRPGEPEYTLFFAEHDNRLKPVLDVWLAPGAREEVMATLRERMPVCSGGCSTPYIHGASIVWAEHAGELRLWRRRRLVGRFKPGESEVRWCLVGPWRRFANSHFSCTHGFLSSSWLWRGVRLQRRDDGTVPIIHSLDPIVLFDPTYHGPELTRDASWVRDLARAISRTTTLPLKLDFPLA
jgi:hypothetical protein